jgi:hypothetical protein
LSPEGYVTDGTVAMAACLFLMIVPSKPIPWRSIFSWNTKRKRKNDCHQDQQVQSSSLPSTKAYTNSSTQPEQPFFNQSSEMSMNNVSTDSIESAGSAESADILLDGVRDEEIRDNSVGNQLSNIAAKIASALSTSPQSSPKHSNEAPTRLTKALLIRCAQSHSADTLEEAAPTLLNVTSVETNVFTTSTTVIHSSPDPKPQSHHSNNKYSPILPWSAMQTLNWDVIFLLGGGFALSAGFEVSCIILDTIICANIVLFRLPVYRFGSQI